MQDMEKENMNIKELLHLIALRKDYFTIERLQNAFDYLVNDGKLEEWVRADIQDIAKEYNIEPFFLAITMPIILATFERDCGVLC